MRKLVIFMVGVLSTSGCAPLIMGGMATAGYMMVQERGAKQAVMDTKVKTHIKDKLTNLDYHYFKDVGVNVLEGNVLLTGMVDDAAKIKHIEQVVRGIPDVKEVYNNILVGSGYSAEQYGRDSWIATQFKTRLLGAKDVYSVNYLTDVVANKVYILGLATTQSEKERVIHLARTTKGVEKVFDFIEVVSKKQ